MADTKVTTSNSTVQAYWTTCPEHKARIAARPEFINALLMPVKAKVKCPLFGWRGGPT